MTMLTAGFADPVRASQATFRAVLDAMARPGTVHPLLAVPPAPRPLAPGAAAVALTLCDHDTPVWLDGDLRANGEVAEWLRFHCGCHVVDDAGRAAFAFAHGATVPAFGTFNPGTADYPDRSTTLVLQVERLQVERLQAGAGLVLAGPGIRDRNALAAAPLPGDMTARLARNHALFPRGIDLLLASADAVAGLPRSVRVVQET
jgi:alpha-D-ribose 1-methylphosphonate 5-triphosphate synthase subunit PhnH